MPFHNELLVTPDINVVFQCHLLFISHLDFFNQIIVECLMISSDIGSKSPLCLPDI